MPTGRPWKPCSPMPPAATTRRSAAATWWATAPIPTAVVDWVRDQLRRGGARQSRQRLHRPGQTWNGSIRWRARPPFGRCRHLTAENAEYIRTLPQGPADAWTLSSWCTARPSTKTNTCWPPTRQGRRSAIWRRRLAFLRPYPRARRLHLEPLARGDHRRAFRRAPAGRWPESIRTAPT